MRQLFYTMFISNNHPSFHLWWKENLVKHRKVSKYYETDCRAFFIICHISPTKLNVILTNKYLPVIQLKNLSPNLTAQWTTTLFKPQCKLIAMKLTFFSSTPQQLGKECNLNIKNLPETFPIISTPIQISTPRTPTTTLDIITVKSKPLAVKRKEITPILLISLLNYLVR